MKRKTAKRPRNVSAWQVQAVRYDHNAGGSYVEATVTAPMPEPLAAKVYCALVDQMKAGGSVNIRIDQQRFEFMDGSVCFTEPTTYTATRPSDGGQR